MHAAIKFTLYNIHRRQTQGKQKTIMENSIILLEFILTEIFHKCSFNIGTHFYISKSNVL